MYVTAEKNPVQREATSEGLDQTQGASRTTGDSASLASLSQSLNASPRVTALASLSGALSASAGPVAQLVKKKGKGNGSKGAKSKSPKKKSKKLNTKKVKRPNFSSAVYKNAVLTYNAQFGAEVDPGDPKLSQMNAAVPHRMSWKDLRDNTGKFVSGTEGSSDFERWTDRFFEAAKSKQKNIEDDDNMGKKKKLLVKHIEKQTGELMEAREELVEAVKNRASDAGEKEEQFLKQLNSYYPNVPDLGPHNGVNNPVRERAHLNIDEDGSMSPMTKRVLSMSPGRLSGVAVDKKGKNLVTPHGNFISLDDLDDDLMDSINQHGTMMTNVKPTDWGDHDDN